MANQGFEQIGISRCSVHVERRVGQHVVELAEASERAFVVGVGLLHVTAQAVDGQVHLGELDGFQRLFGAGYLHVQAAALADLAFERQLFAAKSEQRGVHQRDLFFNEAEALAPVSPAPKVRVPAHQRAKRGRKPLDPGLPREVIRYELPEGERVCPHDGSALKEIGVEASEQLDIVPLQVRVIRHERVKYACPCCSGTVRTAAAPAKLVPKGLLTENALAWVISAKYQDALPLYRQAALLARFGGEIARNTLAHTVVQVGRGVQPLINLLRDHLLDAAILHGDETELQVLKEDGRPARAKSYLWVQMSGWPSAVHLCALAQCQDRG